jgi:hypothetical protein
MLTPTSAHHAKKNVSFSIIPAIPRIVLTKVRITESANPRPDSVVELAWVDPLNFE